MNIYLFRKETERGNLDNQHSMVSHQVDGVVVCAVEKKWENWENLNLGDSNPEESSAATLLSTWNCLSVS